MSYYEELGISPDASNAEIRRSYKRLVRLLHPDVHPDQDLRDAAEIQMRRLNGILAILMNADERRAYDRTLLAVSLVPVAPLYPPPALAGRREDALRFALQYWFWLFIGLVTANVTIWYLLTGDPARTRAAQATSFSAAPSPVQHAAAKPRPLIRSNRFPGTVPTPAPQSTQKFIPGGLPTGELDPEPTEPLDCDLTPAAAPSPIAKMNETGEPQFSKKVVSPAADSFAGSWLYVPQPQTKDDLGLYPPEYIELLLTENNGRLAGDYRARYHIGTTLLSPYVTFHVDGDLPNDGIASLKWTCRQGAKGNVELALRTPDTLHVTWWTTEFGRSGGLTSGSSLLIRQKVRH